MALAYAQRTFVGRDRHGAEYLNIRKGDPLVVDEQSVDEGWILAAKAENNHWKTGWIRSEERRVGKECRSRWSPYH